MSNSELPSVVDLINANKRKQQLKEAQASSPAEIASVTAKQQKLMEQAGDLKLVHLHGPNDTRIPAYFSTAENAFLPVFEVQN